MSFIIEMPQSVAERAEVCLQAWSDHDYERILALHTLDSVLGVFGGPAHGSADRESSRTVQGHWQTSQ